MVVPALARPPHGAGAEQLLDPLEGGPIHEWLVAALVLDPVPFDDADVGPMREEAGEARDGHRLGRVVAATPAVGEPSMGQFLGEAFDRPVARRIQLKGHLHERGAFGVGDDVGHLTPADRLAQVQVAEGALWG